MTDTELIDAYLKHHRPRRFEQGASAAPESLKAFLQKRGYELGFTGWRGGKRVTLRRTGQRGRPSSMNMHELLALVDELRLSDGLQPILKPDSDIERELELLAA